MPWLTVVAATDVQVTSLTIFLRAVGKSALGMRHLRNLRRGEVTGKVGDVKLSSEEQIAVQRINAEDRAANLRNGRGELKSLGEYVNAAELTHPENTKRSSPPREREGTSSRLSMGSNGLQGSLPLPHPPLSSSPPPPVSTLVTKSERPQQMQYQEAMQGRQSKQQPQPVYVLFSELNSAQTHQELLDVVYRNNAEAQRCYLDLRA